MLHIGNKGGKSGLEILTLMHNLYTISWRKEMVPKDRCVNVQGIPKAYNFDKVAFWLVRQAESGVLFNVSIKESLKEQW